MTITLDQAFDDARALIAPARAITLLRLENFSLKRTRIPQRNARLAPGVPELEIVDQVALFEFIDVQRQKEAQGWTGPSLNLFQDKFDARRLGEQYPNLYWLTDFVSVCSIHLGQPRKKGVLQTDVPGVGFSMEIGLESTILDRTAVATLALDAAGFYSGTCGGNVLDRQGRPIGRADCEVRFRPVSVQLHAPR